MSAPRTLIHVIEEILRENGWEQDLVAEALPGGGSVQVRKARSAVPPAPEDIVNVYPDGGTAPEQVQQECLRFLRTGRTGL